MNGSCLFLPFCFPPPFLFSPPILPIPPPLSITRDLDPLPFSPFILSPHCPLPSPFLPPSPFTPPSSPLPLSPSVLSPPPFPYRPLPSPFPPTVLSPPPFPLRPLLSPFPLPLSPTVLSSPLPLSPSVLSPPPFPYRPLPSVLSSPPFPYRPPPFPLLSSPLPLSPSVLSFPSLSTPMQVRIMFEVQDLRYATLATVSRCGMVWFSESVLSLDIIFEHFLNKLRNIPIDEGEDEARSWMSSAPKSPAVQKDKVLSPTLQVSSVVFNCGEHKTLGFKMNSRKLSLPTRTDSSQLRCVPYTGMMMSLLCVLPS